MLKVFSATHKSREKSWGERLETLALNIVGLLAAAFSLFLSMTSLLHTTAVKYVKQEVHTIVYNIQKHVESVIYYNDNLFLNLLVLALSLAICFIIITKLKGIRLRYVLLFLFLWTFVLGTIWVLSSQTAPTSDSAAVTSAAWEFAQNDFSSLESKRYFKNFPYQLGYVLFNELIIRLVFLLKRPETLLFLEVLNAVFLAVINVFVVLINHQIFKDERITNLTALILALSIAPIISCSFIYGILPGMMFAVIALYCEIRWLQENRFLFGVLSIVSMAAAVLIKSNYLIWLIALVLIAGVSMFRRKKYLLDCVYIVLVIALSLSVQPAVKRMYERRSGVELGDSIPYISWIAMGLNESDLAPGWYYYTYTIVNFENSDFSAEVAAERSAEEIKSRIQYFIENPQYTNDFFYLKTVSQWNDTSYQSIWSNVVRYEYREKNALADWVCNRGEDRVRGYMDYVAQLVFFAFFVGCIFMIRRKTFICALTPLIFVGGYMYHLISEGKSQYIMPYFIMMCGFAAFGIVCMHETYSQWKAARK